MRPKDPGTIYESCPVCGSQNVTESFKMSDRHYMVSSKEFPVWKCSECETQFLNPMPLPEDISGLYPKSYYSFSEFKKPKWWHKQLVKLLRLEPSDLDNIAQVDGHKMLDFGCGSGWTLDQYAAQGYQTFGLDLDAEAVKIGALKGHEMKACDIVSAAYKTNEFDYIRSNHSLEHVVNPTEVVAEFARILKPGALLFINVPNNKSATCNLFGKYWYYTGVPFHTVNYNIKGLTIMLEKQGFKVIKSSTRSSWQGILGSFAIYLNRKTNRASLENVVVRRSFRPIAILISKLFDMARLGDSVEIYAENLNN